MDTPMPFQKNHLLLLVLGFAVAAGVIVWVVYSQKPNNMSLPTPTQPVGDEASEEKSEAVDNQIVAGMPDVPLFPGATIEKSQKHTVGGDTNYLITMETDATMAEFITFYERELPKDGWTVTNMPTNKDQIEGEVEGTIEATKGNMDVLMNIEREDTGNPIEIAVSLYIKKQ